jgi:hypothetical protein
MYFSNNQKMDFWILEILNFFEQKFCKPQISNLGMAITLANCKLETNTWCHFVRIKVHHMTSYSKFGIF